MLDAVKRYAAGILLIHLVLLVVVVFFVLVAARQVQTSARDQAQVKDKERLELLADQTARGIEAQYNTILSNLDVMLRDPSAATSTAPATGPATQEAPIRGGIFQGRGGRGGQGGGGGRGGRGFAPRIDLTQPVNVSITTLTTLWRQLSNSRSVGASQMFLVNLNTQRVAVTFPETPQATANSMALSRANIDWLRGLKYTDMSAFVPPTASLPGYHLIAVPAIDVGVGLGGTGTGNPNGNRGGNPGSGNFGGGPGGFGDPNGPGGPGGGGRGGERGPGNFGGRGGPEDPGAFGGPPQGEPSTAPQTQPVPQFAVVVVVPIDKAREQFLDPLNGQQNHEVSATLINDRGQILTATQLPPGSNLIEQVDDSVRSQFEDLIMTEHADPVSVVLDKDFSVAGQKFAPRILASAQLEVPSGRHWTVLVGTPLSEVENVVNQLFGKAFAWAIFVSVAITAILASTSFFLIRARVRLERTRHEMLTRELEQARHIQLAWLPDLKSVPAGIEVSAANLPASHISGDFYNWFPLPSVMQRTSVTAAASADPSEIPTGKIAIVIGDVTGHGMAAAFLMATTQLLIRMSLTRYGDAGRALREVNKQLCMQSGGGFKGQFVTMLVMVLDTQHNSIQVASAGHPTPLLEIDGTFKSLEVEPQLVLGVNPDEDYHAKTYPLDAGASVVLYTDGVVEAEAPAGGQYGMDRLLKLVQTSPGLQPANRIRAILEDIKRFAGSRELHDDVTLVALRTMPAVVAADA